MITEKDLQEAIAECRGVKNPNANTCIKLAAFYTIKNQLYPDDSGYSFTSSPRSHVSVIEYDGVSEFAEVTNGKEFLSVWGVIEELMTTLQITNPRLYNNVIQKIKGGA